MRLNYDGAVAQVDSFPGCSQIAIIHSAFVLPEHRGKGYGTRAHQQRLEDLYSEYHYDVAIATVDEANLPQITIMLKSGWKRVNIFTSRRTGHRVGVWINNLNKE